MKAVVLQSLNETHINKLTDKKHCSTAEELRQIRAALNYTESYWGPAATATTSCTQKRPCTAANESDPLHLCWMNNTFLIRIQAARSFDRWHSSMAAADADVKYMLLLLLLLLHVLKYAGRNSDDTSPPWVVLIFNPSLSECKQRVKASCWWANAAGGLLEFESNRFQSHPYLYEMSAWWRLWGMLSVFSHSEKYLSDGGKDGGGESASKSFTVSY